MSLFTASMGVVAKPAAAGNPSAVVSGAGTAAANGTYTYRGENGGKPYYNLLGEPDSTINSAVVWTDAWYIKSSAGVFLYNSGEEVAFPWETAAWSATDGDEPPPTVTQS